MKACNFFNIGRRENSKVFASTEIRTVIFRSCENSAHNVRGREKRENLGIHNFCSFSIYLFQTSFYTMWLNLFIFLNTQTYLRHVQLFTQQVLCPYLINWENTELLLSVLFSANFWKFIKLLLINLLHYCPANVMLF